MINPKELRLENLLLYSGKPIPIYSIESGGHTFWRINYLAINKNTGCTINGGEDVYDPILLTDEWLDKLGIRLWAYRDPGGADPFDGFKLSDNLFLQKNYCRDGSGHYDGYLMVIKTGVVFRTVMDCQPIKTVHRLQNIVFELTGQKLTLKEPI